MNPKTIDRRALLTGSAAAVVAVAALAAPALARASVQAIAADSVFAAIAKWEPARRAHTYALLNLSDEENSRTGDALYEIECDIAEMDATTRKGLLAKLDWFDAMISYYGYGENTVHGDVHECGYAPVALHFESVARTIRKLLAVEARP
jgi:hypothetical protein